MMPTTFAPYVSNLPASGLTWDPRLTQRGAVLTPYAPLPGATYYRLIRGEWRDENQGPPAILIDVIDEQGRRLTGVPVHCFNGGEVIHFTEAKPRDDWATDFPMFNVGCAYRIQVGPASDKIGCLGLGSLADPYHAHHSGFLFIFQRTTYDGVTVPDPPAPPPVDPPLPPTLDPILDALSRARQSFDDAYRQARTALDEAIMAYSRQTGR